MNELKDGLVLLAGIVVTAILVAAGCQPPPANSNVANTVAINTNTNTNVNSNSNMSASTTTITTGEPEQYQANVKLTLETLGDQKTSIPPIGAMVARSGADRVMVFTLPTNEKVIYLDKGGMNYLILPNRKQYAELTKEALGFEVRRLLMPEQIVQQVKAIPGVRLVGEETTNGRTVVKYAYSGAANTGTQAGNVTTESYILVDKETGLPIRSETVSQSQSGANVQGVSGARMLTEMTDITATPDANNFTLPSDFQKIDAEKVKEQANLIFSAVAAIIGQAMKQAQAPNPSPSASVATSPAR